MKTLQLIECRRCRSTIYAGDKKIVLYPGDERTPPDDVSVIVRVIAECEACKLMRDRSKGQMKKRRNKYDSR